MIAVRGRFIKELDKKYQLLYSDMVQSDPCFGLVSSIYRDKDTGIYYSSRDGVNFFAADGVWYLFMYNVGNDYYWDSYYIMGTDLYPFGMISSPCAPI